MFKKSKSRNVRKKDKSDVIGDEAESATIVKRSQKSKSGPAKPKLSFADAAEGEEEVTTEDAEGKSEFKLKKSRASLKLKDGAEASTRIDDSNEDNDGRPKYTAEYMKSLRDQSTSKAAAESMPFDIPEGIPTADQIELAKKLREQRRTRAQQEEFISLIDSAGVDNQGISRLIVSDDEMVDNAGPSEDHAYILDPSQQKRQETKNARDRYELINEAEADLNDSSFRQWELDHIKYASIPVDTSKGSDSGQVSTTTKQIITNRGGELSYAFARQRLEALLESERAKHAQRQQVIASLESDIERSIDVVKTLQDKIEEARLQRQHFEQLEKSEEKVQITADIVESTASMSINGGKEVAREGDGENVPEEQRQQPPNDIEPLEPQ
ncbi:hypothetical protein EV182_001886 [Spiromyces aspiralis]|uniref:Uncharacterized protein n=1 Tax=Spiromyces aspiralis TaxID=68401 RepID=A0ACC1HTE8_9FUNG|nr:hypothetical protein EV182_001886 [Spiromyces aspiralis]